MNINQLILEKVCNDLQDVTARLDALYVRMQKESQVQADELKERRAMGLNGRDALTHYNQYMHDHGLSHLIIKDV